MPSRPSSEHTPALIGLAGLVLAGPVISLTADDVDLFSGYILALVALFGLVIFPYSAYSLWRGTASAEAGVRVGATRGGYWVSRAALRACTPLAIFFSVGTLFILLSLYGVDLEGTAESPVTSVIAGLVGLWFALALIGHPRFLVPPSARDLQAPS